MQTYEVRMQWNDPETMHRLAIYKLPYDECSIPIATSAWFSYHTPSTIEYAGRKFFCVTEYYAGTFPVETPMEFSPANV